ncbi:hypothetical protein [Pedobacter gandavensis]|uniref:hypothetical protein n=1 Tax=Pedobacter gandavensis TaxID=2679963 RepID=UPI00292D8D2F|nr:hypothetical protein [Pedobacter gandavensis]
MSCAYRLFVYVKDGHHNVDNGNEGYVTSESYPGMKLSLKTVDWTYEIGNGIDGWVGVRCSGFSKTIVCFLGSP